MADPAPRATVRPARAADLEALVRWNAAMARETEARELPLETLRAGVAAALADPAKGFYLVAELAGTPVGGVLVTFEWSDWRNAPMWWLQSVYVDPAARGRGVFRALFAAVRERAAAAGVASLRLYVERDNRRAQQTYAALGMHHSDYLMYELELAALPPRTGS